LHSVYWISNVNDITSGHSTNPQELTATAVVEDFYTPTLTFAEIGSTLEQTSPGYASCAAGVGEFPETKILERMCFLHTQDWSIADSQMTASSSPVHFMNCMALLADYPKNRAILNQFHYFRADIEVTFRLNTNQFYYGALMCSMWPGDATGERPDSRAVLDPAIVSAMSSDALVRTWSYSFPDAWLQTNKLDTFGAYPVWFAVDVLAPLSKASEDIPDSVTMSMWARFVNVKLAFPKSASLPEAQSASAPAFSVTVAQKKKRPSPSKDPSKTNREGSSSLTKAVQAVRRVTIGEAWDVGVGIVNTAIKFLPFFFDKPDRVVVQTPMITENCADCYAMTIADSNPVFAVNPSLYLDPDVRRMPMSGNWTVQQYAAIPGVCALQTLTDEVPLP